MHMGVLLEEIRWATPLSKGFRNVTSHLSVEWVCKCAAPARR